MITTREDIDKFVTNTLGDDASVIIFDDSMGYGYFDAFIGVTDDGIAFYNYDRMVEHICNKDNEMTVEDASDWISFNTLRALYNPNDPHIVYTYDGISIDDALLEFESDKLGYVKEFSDAFIGVCNDMLVYDISKCNGIEGISDDVREHAFFINIA